MRSPKFTRFLLFLVALISITATLLIRWPARQDAALDRRTNAGTTNAPVQPIAVTFTVNASTDLPDSSVGDGHCDTDGNLGNGDQCTLRAAIEEANALTASGTIDINFSGVVSPINLGSALPDIGHSININGPGAALLTVRRNTGGNYRIFNVITTDSVAFSGLTINNGRTPDPGGGINNSSTGTVNVTNCTLNANGSDVDGGGINNDGSGTVNVANSTLSANFTGSAGGGITNRSTGTVNVTNSTITANLAASGGGIYNIASGGSVNLTNSTVSDNSASLGGGGGINNNPGCLLTVINSTISGNRGVTGGGIRNSSSGTVSITNGTITGNFAGSTSPVQGGGGISTLGGPVNIGNTIVAGNTANNLGPDINGTFTTQGNNLIGKIDGGSGFTNGVNGDQVGSSGSPIDPLLGPLADNGGSTKTHALLVGSSAIDAGNSAQTTDQRGQSRPIDDPNVANAAGGNASDIGAYESNIFQVNTTADADDGACTGVGTGNGCTLREAINAANTNLGEVSFAPALTSGGPAVISLATALPPISSRVIIQGPGPALLTIQRSSVGGTPEFSVFVVNNGAVGTISKLTISNGKVSNPNPGGGILNSGTLTLNDSTVSANNPIGIRNVGNLTINNGLITGNTSGGISSTVGDGSTISLTVNNSFVGWNGGTGINSTASNGNSTLIIDGSLISGNIGGFLGGGVANGAGSFTSTAVLTINNSTISGNSSTNGGGGVYNAAVFASASATATINNTTISGNFDNTDGGGIYDVTSGPGVTSNLTLTNCTITNNNVSSSGSGGGIGISTFQNPAVVRLRNSIVAGNRKNSGTPDDIVGSIDSSSSFNLIGTGGSGGLSNGTNNNQVGVASPGLGPLADNGGFTPTHTLLPGSPAIDAGDNCVVTNSCSPALTSALTIDQRGSGFNRSSDGNGDGTVRVDIGAYEVQSILVTNLNDSGVGSLRQAIIDANASPDANAINFQTGLTGTITLLTALPDLSTSMSINGPGASVLTVSGNNANRVFNVQSATVAMSGITITNGNPGGILNAGTLTLTNVAVNGNSGLGISNGGILTVLQSTISGNTAPGSDGGGIYNGSSLTVINSTISGNSAFRGGGLYVSFGAGASATLVNSTVSGNSAGQGGGIYNERGLKLTNSTLSGNSSAGEGGGLYSHGTSTLNSVSISNNRSDSNDSGGEPGGGIFVASVSPNLNNTIVAGNFRGTGTTRDDVKGLLSPASYYNLIGDGTNMNGITNGDSNGNHVGGSGSPINAMLGALANNGGATQTQALLPGSPAINAGSNANLPADSFDLNNNTNTAEPLPVDQRGFARVTNSTVDIGAFESRGFTIAATGGTPQSATITSPFSTPLSATISSAFGEPVANGVITFTAPANGASGTFNGGVTTMTATANSSGVATSSTFTANSLAGSYSVNAGANGITSSANFNLTNLPAATTTGVSSSINPSNLGQNATFTATVSSSGGTPTGTVQFKDGGASLGSPVILGSGVAQLATSSLTAGSHTITAEYSGDPNFTASMGTLSGGQSVLPAVSINDVSATEGDSGTKSFVFTVTLSAASNLTISVDFATANGTATPGSDYVAPTPATLTFNPGETQKTIAVTVNGDQKFESDENFFVNLSNPTHATISDNQGQGTIVNDDAQGGIISFSASQYTVSEADGSLTITVSRAGDTTAAATVNYATDDTGSPGPCATFNGFASSKCDFTTAIGILTFAPNETQKTFTVLVNRDSYGEIPYEIFAVKLSSLTGGAVLGTPSTTTVRIMDSGGPAPNAIDDSAFFVRQHYHDFLNREPDASGLQFWTNEIESCGTDTGCREVKRINVSAAFFLSIEFQQTGYLVERLYKTAYGDAVGNSTFPSAHTLPVPIVRFNEFLADTQEISRGVVVGQTGWEQQIENNKAAFINSFVQRSRFTNIYASVGNAAFVDMLNQNANFPLSPSERSQLVSDLDNNLKPRAQALRTIAEHPNLVSAESNRAFVLMQFFGYLRRNPDDPQDHDHTGYDFWLTKLNQFGGNFQNAEMVRAFISSDEYRQRFGP